MTRWGLLLLLVGFNFVVSGDRVFKVQIDSPTPDRFEILPLYNAELLLHKESGAFIVVKWRGDDDKIEMGKAHPEKNVWVRDYHQVDSEDAEVDRWAMVLLPDLNSVVQDLDPASWLRETDFNDDDADRFGGWMDERSDADPFAVIIIHGAWEEDQAGSSEHDADDELVEEELTDLLETNLVLEKQTAANGQMPTID